MSLKQPMLKTTDKVIFRHYHVVRKKRFEALMSKARA
jgi:hypothetical protein